MAVLLQRLLTVLFGGHNVVYFARYWRRLARRDMAEGSQRGLGGPPNARRGRRIAAAVLALTNMALMATGMASFIAPSFPLNHGQPGAQAVAGLLPLAAAAAMTGLILRGRIRV